MFGGSTFSGEQPAWSWWPCRSALQGVAMRYTSSRRVVVLAVLFLLIAPWASAAPRHESAQPAGISGAPDLLSLAWSLMTGGWMKEGCMIDPDGRCVTSVPTKEGCNIDPFGRCLPASATVNSLRPG